MAVLRGPDDHKILNNLGVAYAKMAKYDNAAHAFHQALVLAPEVALIRYNLGQVYASKGDRPEALRHYDILKAIDPKLGMELYQEIYRDRLIVVR